MTRPALALALAAALAAPAPATLELGAPIGPISPLAVGGLNHSRDLRAANDRALLLRLGVTSLRFPGGNWGDEYDMLGPERLRVLALERELLGRPRLVLQARVFGGTPEAAARVARDAKAAGLEVAYWNIGNEPDRYKPLPDARGGPVGGRGDPSWTPERYCRAFRAYREAIRAVDPGARFAGPSVSKGVDEPGSAARAASFLMTFVRECGDVVDLLTWHEYPTNGLPPERGGLSDEAALATAAGVSERLERWRALLSSPETNPLGHGRRIGLGVTEYGLSWSDSPRHTADQVAALWAAEATLRLAEGGAELASYFAVQGLGGHGLLDTAGGPRPAYYAFLQLKDFRGEAMRLRSSDPRLWTHAARDGERLTVLVANTATADSSLDPRIAGWTPVGAKTFTEETVENEAPLVRLPLSPAVPLPARSLTRVVYKRAPGGA
jgi:hypothetical protein